MLSCPVFLQGFFVPAVAPTAAQLRYDVDTQRSGALTRVKFPGSSVVEL
jgi:hypothetical protein